jgi:hypothetical protein
MREIRNVYKIYVVKPKRKIPRHRWEDNVETDYREIVLVVVDWVHLGRDQ